MGNTKKNQEAENTSKVDVKKPTVGRIVHYFPNGGDGMVPTTQPHFGARVVTEGSEESPLRPLLKVDSPLEGMSTLIRPNVSHKSEVADGTNIPYWEWPEITK